MKVSDVEGTRFIEVDGRNRWTPTSVFIMGDGGLCIEVDRESFVSAIMQEFGLDRVAIAA